MNAKCSCQNCNGEFEFDVAEFQESNRIGSMIFGQNVPCPHCGLETSIYLEESPKLPPAHCGLETALSLPASVASAPLHLAQKTSVAKTHPASIVIGGILIVALLAVFLWSGMGNGNLSESIREIFSGEVFSSSRGMDESANGRWNQNENDAMKNGNISVAVREILARPAFRDSAIDYDPQTVAKRPYDYYGKVSKFSGTVAHVQDYATGSDFSKLMGNAESSDIVALTVDNTIVEMFCMKPSGNIKVGDTVTLYGYAVGVTDVPNGFGGSSTHLIVVGNDFDSEPTSQSIATTSQPVAPVPKVSISNIDAEIPDEGGMHITGIIKNLSDVSLNAITVQFSVFDEDGNKVDDVMDFIQTLEPNETWNFKASSLKDNCKKYRLDGITSYIDNSEVDLDVQQDTSSTQ